MTASEDRRAAEERSSLDQVLDVVVYAPLGLLLTAKDELPRLIEKGRQRASGQLVLARMVGEMAVAQGQKEAERWFRQAVSRLSEPDEDVTSGPLPPPPPAPAATASGATERPVATPSADRLAIPGYDALSASQVVQRLAGLSPDELEAVRVYETATRHRRTILGRVAQLQSSA